MNYQLGTDNDPAAPWNENIDHLAECKFCHCVFIKCEGLQVDGEWCCDEHSQDLTTLRFEGLIRGVAEKTGKIARPLNYQKLYDRVYDETYRNVKHI